MKKFLLLTSVFALAVAGHATVLTFDDIAGGPGTAVGTYNALTFSSDVYIYDTASYDSGYGNTYGAVSPTQFVYNGFGDTPVTVTGSSFVFNGADFSTWAGNDAFQSYSSSTVTVTGYLGGNLVGTDTFNLSSTGFNWDGVNWGGPIDTLDISSDGSGRWWTMDNMTINQSSTPSPAAALPFIVGFLARRKRK